MEAPHNKADPISSSNPRANTPVVTPQATGTLKGRRVSLKTLKAEAGKFFHNLWNLFNPERIPSPRKIFSSVRVLPREAGKDVPSPMNLAGSVENINYNKLLPHELGDKAKEINGRLKEFTSSLPGNDRAFMKELLFLYVQSDDELDFFQNALKLENLPSEEKLEQAFQHFEKHKETVLALKNEYQVYQNNFNKALKTAIKLNDEFMKVYLHDAPGYDREHGLVAASQQQLEFAKALAQRYFPHILLFNWLPKQELQNACLIQAIIVGKEVLGNDQSLLLPKEPACFILKETMSKQSKGTPKKLNQGISFAFNQLVHFKSGVEKEISPGQQFETADLMENFRAALHIFTKDCLKRPGNTLVIQNREIALGEKETPPITDLFIKPLIQHLQNNPAQITGMIAQAKKSPLVEALKQVFPDEYKRESEHKAAGTLGETDWFPQNVFANLIDEEIAINHSDNMTPHQLKVEQDLIRLKQVSAEYQQALESLVNPILQQSEDAMAGTQLIRDLHCLIRFKLLQAFLFTSQASILPMNAQLLKKIYSDETPFFPSPTIREFHFTNDLDTYSAVLKSDIAAPATQLGEPNLVMDLFNERPIIARVSQSTAIPSVGTTTHNEGTTAILNVLGELKVSWKTPQAALNNLVKQVLPDYEPAARVDHKKNLVENFLPQLEILKKIQPGDDLVFDNHGVHVNPFTLNKIRPVTNQLLNSLPASISEGIKEKTGYSAKNTYNPRVAEQLEEFADNLDKAIKNYVQQAVIEGQSHDQINRFIMNDIGLPVAQAHMALLRWGQVPQLIEQGGRYYRIVQEVGSVYLEEPSLPPTS